MMANNGFIRIDLTTPIIPSDPRMTADGLLGGILFEKHRDGPLALENLPVATRDDIPLASQGFMQFPAIPQSVTIYGNIASEPAKDAMAFSRIETKIPRVDGNAGPYKTKEGNYIAYATPALWFLVRGDLAAINDLLADAPFIGTLRSKGWGEVAGYCVGEVRTANPWHGVVSAGRVLRPIPTRCRSLLPELIDYTVRTETWRSPYSWSERAEPCMVPPYSGPLTVAEIRDLGR